MGRPESNTALGVAKGKEEEVVIRRPPNSLD